MVENNPVILCVCGEELKVVQYNGYYESFKFLDCYNEKCGFVRKSDVDEELDGQFG